MLPKFQETWTQDLPFGSSLLFFQSLLYLTLGQALELETLGLEVAESSEASAHTMEKASIPTTLLALIEELKASLQCARVYHAAYKALTSSGPSESLNLLDPVSCVVYHPVNPSNGLYVPIEAQKALFNQVFGIYDCV